MSAQLTYRDDDTAQERAQCRYKNTMFTSSAVQQGSGFAQGELEVLLDLVAAVEAGQALAVANVPPRKSTLEGLTSARTLLLQTQQQQLQARSACRNCMRLDGMACLPLAVRLL